MTTVDHVTCCCTETRETIQRLEAAYGAACQRLTETEAALVEVTGERDRARDLAVRLWDDEPGTGDAVPGLGIVQIRPFGQNAGADTSPSEIAREARTRCCAGDGLPEAGGVCETHAQETSCG